MPRTDMSEPPMLEEVPSPPTLTAARNAAALAWNLLKGETDPEFDVLAPDTQMRLATFAREIRNMTIEHLAGAIKKYYERTNAIAVESILSLKE